MVAKTCYFGFKLIQRRRRFSPHGKKKKKSIFSSPRAIYKCTDSMSCRPEEEGDWAWVTFSLPAGSSCGWTAPGGAGLWGWRGWRLGAGWQPGQDLPPTRPAAPGRARQITANTSRPASTGIPNRDKSGAPGGKLDGTDQYEIYHC